MRQAIDGTVRLKDWRRGYRRNARYGTRRSSRSEERVPRGFHVVCTQEFSVSKDNLWYEKYENEMEQDVLASCVSNGVSVWCPAQVG